MTIDNLIEREKRESVQAQRRAHREKAVRVYDYNRQWLTHRASIDAALTRVPMSPETLKAECIKAGVWEP